MLKWVWLLVVTFDMFEACLTGNNFFSQLQLVQPILLRYQVYIEIYYLWKHAAAMSHF